MLRSMTGFGTASGQIGGLDFAVEVRTVNNRYYKAVVKLPDCYSSIELDVDRLLRKKMARGTITCSVRMKFPDAKAAYDVNTAALSKYIDQLKICEVDANPMLRLDIGALLQLPGVCEPPEMGDLLTSAKAGLMELITSAIDAAVGVRETEGETLKADLLANCQIIDDLLAKVSERAPEVVETYRLRLTTRINELLDQGRAEIDADILAREVAIFADRSDVAEELSRLGCHVQQFRAVIEAPAPAGRKLDFIAQEMLREANTIASKGYDTTIVQTAVEMKAAIDRIKEQVQNAE